MLERVERAAARRRIGQPAADAGTDRLPQIQHIVVLMMENHSYDNYLGTLERGDGLPVGPDGKPAVSNSTLAGVPVPLAYATSTVQLPLVPTQCWYASHLQWNGGACDGFVTSLEQLAPGSDAAAGMQYWTEADLPFYHGLARTFPLATRWFCSCLGPTFPNRRFLVSATAHGLIDDIPYGMIDYPKTGTIFDHLSANGISWVNYHHVPPATVRRRRLTRAPGVGWLRLLVGGIGGGFHRFMPELESKVQTTADVYPLDFLRSVNHLRPIDDFFTAAQAGQLPAVSIVDPDFDGNSEENPQDIRQGEAFAARVINAVMQSPAWPHTLLVWLYDEHGGYYDHVKPPPAVAPDDVPAKSLYDRFFVLRLFKNTALGRKVTAADTGPRTYEQLGFRVPAVIVSPYARPDYVSEQVYDHTAILRLIQHKWSLPPLTRRDAAAADLLEMVDLSGPGAFLTPPQLPEPALSAS
jgi:phospholipase C